MTKNFKTIFEEIKSDVIGTVTAQVELQKLNAIEKGVPAAVRGGYFAIIGVIGVTMLLFLLITAGFALGLLFAGVGEAFPVLRALTLGFLVLTGILLLVDVLLLLLSNPICTAIQTAVINKQLDKMEQADREKSDSPAGDPTNETLLMQKPETEVITVDPSEMQEEKL